MARQITRNYTYQVPRVSTKELKIFLDSSKTWEFTNKGLRLIVQVKNEVIIYKLPNGVIVYSMLNKTALSFGWRYWFICPCCQKRKGMLYYSNDNIGCRECFNLHYKSQSYDLIDRLGQRIYKLRHQTFGDISHKYNLQDSVYCMPKPKGMSKKRFEKERAIISKKEWDRTMILDGMIERLINKNPHFLVR